MADRSGRFSKSRNQECSAVNFSTSVVLPSTAMPTCTLGRSSSVNALPISVWTVSIQLETSSSSCSSYPPSPSTNSASTSTNGCGVSCWCGQSCASSSSWYSSQSAPGPYAETNVRSASQTKLRCT